MADENPQVSGQAGEEGLPTPQFSDNGGSSPSVDVDVIVNRVVERLTPTLEQVAERKAKSLQDKRFNKIEKELGLRSGVLAELESEGVTIPQEVRTRMEIRELREQVAQRDTQPETVRDAGPSQQKTAVTEAIAELQKYELDQNDPAFLELLRGKYQDRAAFDLAIQKHIVNRLKPPKPASVADVVQGPATSQAASTKLSEEKRNEIASRMAKLSKEDPRGNLKEIMELRDQLQKGGD